MLSCNQDCRLFPLALIVAGLAAGIAITQPAGAGDHLEILVKDGDAAPGTTGFFDLKLGVNSFPSVMIDDSGKVFFFAAATDEAGIREGIWAGHSGSLQAIAVDGQILPQFQPTLAECEGVGPLCGQIFNTRSPFYVTPGGKVLLRTTREDIIGSVAFLAGTQNADLAPILVSTQTMDFPFNVSIGLGTEAGDYLVDSFIGNNPFGAPNGGLLDFAAPLIDGPALSIPDPLTINEIFGTNATSAGVTFGFNQGAGVLFVCELSDLSEALYFDPAGAIPSQLLAHTGEQPPGIPDDAAYVQLTITPTVGRSAIASINDSSKGFFSGTWYFANQPLDNNNRARKGIWRFDTGATPSLVVSEYLHPAFDIKFATSEGPSTVFDNISRIKVAPNGDIHFKATSRQADENGIPDSSDVRVGVWRAPADGSPLDLVLRVTTSDDPGSPLPNGPNMPGTPLPGGKNFLGLGFSGYGFDRNSRMVFTTADALYAQDEIGILQLIIESGQMIQVAEDDTRIVDLILLNNLGLVGGTSVSFRKDRLAFNVRFEDGSFAIMRSTVVVSPATNYVWSGDGGDTNWHNLVNWQVEDDVGELQPADHVPGDPGGNGLNEAADIGLASVVISTDAVTLRSINTDTVLIPSTKLAGGPQTREPSGSLEVNQPLTLSEASKIKNLKLKADLTSNAVLTLEGTGNVWTDGKIKGTGSVSVAANSKLAIQPVGSSLRLDVALTTAGEVQQTGGKLDLLFGPGTIEVQAGGNYEIQAGEINNTAGRVTVQSGGMFLKTGMGGDATLNVPITIESGATIRSEGGTLTLQAAFSHFDGTLEISNRAEIELPMFSFFNGFMASGPGIVRMQGDNTFTATSIFNHMGGEVGDGVGLEILDGTQLMGGGGLEVQGKLNITGAVEVGVELDINGGAAVLTEAVLNLNVSSSGISVTNGGSFTLEGASSIMEQFSNGDPFVLDNGTLIKSGADTTSAIEIPLMFNSGSIKFESGTLQLKNGGDFKTEQIFMGSGAALELHTGTFKLAGAFTLNGSGQFLIRQGATLQRNSGLLTVNLFATSEAPNAGLILDGGTITGNQVLKLSGQMNWQGGRIDGGKVLIENGSRKFLITNPTPVFLNTELVMAITDGISQAGDITLLPSGSIVFEYSSAKYELDGKILGAGDIDMPIGGIITVPAGKTSSIGVPLKIKDPLDNSYLILEAGATLTFLDPASVTVESFEGVAPILKDGEFRHLNIKVGDGANLVFQGAGDILTLTEADVEITGTGKFNNITKAIENFRIDRSSILVLDNVPQATYAGDLDTFGRLDLNGLTFVNVTGDLDVESSLHMEKQSLLLIGGQLEFSSLSFGFIDGTVNANASFPFFSVDVAFDATLRGSGSINGQIIRNGGLVDPGSSPGVLTINGDYTQPSGGVLGLEIGGLVAGTQYDQFIVNGTATFEAGAKIEITLIDPDIGDCVDQLFVPLPGDTFELLSADQLIFDAAEFSDLIRFTNVPAGLGLGFELSFPGDMVVLQVTEVTGVADFIFGEGFEGDCTSVTDIAGFGR